MSFLTDLGRRITNTTGDKNSLAYLLQKVFCCHSEGECCIHFENFASNPLSFEWSVMIVVYVLLLQLNLEEGKK